MKARMKNKHTHTHPASLLIERAAGTISRVVCRPPAPPLSCTPYANPRQGQDEKWSVAPFFFLFFFFLQQQRLIHGRQRCSSHCAICDICTWLRYQGALPACDRQSPALYRRGGACT